MFPVPNGHTEDHVSSFCPSCACTSRSHLASRHSEVPEGDLMDVAAPGEGEAVPLQKLIGFGMVGGYLWNGWGSCPGSSIPFYRPWLGASPFVPKCCVHKVWAAISQDKPFVA